MTSYIIRRLIQMIFVLLIVSVLVFLAAQLLPGDPVIIYLSGSETSTNLTQEQIDKTRHELGLDRPLYTQYLSWLSRAVMGDLGTSIVHRGKVIDDIKQRLPITLHIGLFAFLLSIIFGIPMGVIAAIRRASALDSGLTSLGNLGVCVPIFWLGILLLYLFGLKLDWLPVYGYTSPFEDFWLNTKQIILPVFCLAVPGIASAMRLTRSSMLEVLRQDYIRTAWSKGLSESVIIRRHALKNGLMPVITLKGMSFAAIIGGSVLVETVFGIPGMGRLAVEALFSQDFIVIQGVLVVLGLILLCVNLLIDISYAWLDPRIRLG